MRNILTTFFKSLRPLFKRFNRSSSDIHIRYVGACICADLVAIKCGQVGNWTCSNERSLLMEDIAYIEKNFDDYLTNSEIIAKLGELKTWYLISTPTPVLNILINFCAAHGIRVSQAELLKESNRVSSIFIDNDRIFK